MTVEINIETLNKFYVELLDQRIYAQDRLQYVTQNIEAVHELFKSLNKSPPKMQSIEKKDIVNASVEKESIHPIQKSKNTHTTPSSERSTTRGCVEKVLNKTPITVKNLKEKMENKFNKKFYDGAVYRILNEGKRTGLYLNADTKWSKAV